jgi:hypothetical protein
LWFIQSIVVGKPHKHKAHNSDRRHYIAFRSDLSREGIYRYASDDPSNWRNYSIYQTPDGVRGGKVIWISIDINSDPI